MVETERMRKQVEICKREKCPYKTDKVCPHRYECLHSKLFAWKESKNGDEYNSQEWDLLFDGKYKCTGCSRTGCIFCAYGAHLEKESRFVRLKQTHPKQYNYCINGGAYDENGIWKPNEDGLGMGHVFDELNEMYSKNGKEFIEYK